MREVLCGVGNRLVESFLMLSAKEFCPLFLQLKQVVLRLLHQIADRAIGNLADGRLNDKQLLQKNSVTHDGP